MIEQLDSVADEEGPDGSSEVDSSSVDEDSDDDDCDGKDSIINSEVSWVDNHSYVSEGNPHLMESKVCAVYLKYDAFPVITAPVS